VDDDTQPDIVIEITQPYDQGEWLAGYTRGVTAGRKDVLKLISDFLGRSDLANELMSRIIATLEQAGP